MGNKLDIYIVCHKEAYIPDIGCFRPIQVGAALTSRRLSGMQPDNEGDNISEKNKSFCELTAQYWAWKNSSSDYVGFFHYRRYFSFDTSTEYEEDGWGNIAVGRIGEAEIKRFGLSDEQIETFAGKYDIITVKPRDINEHRKLAGGRRLNIYEEYGSSDAQHTGDLDKALEILGERYPEYRQAAENYMHSDRAYECNMFIMSRPLYNDYCAWLFDILLSLEQELDTSDYNQEELRVYGFIAERLFGIYYTKLLADGEVRHCELQKILIADTEPKPYIGRLDWGDIKGCAENAADKDLSGISAESKDGGNASAYSVWQAGKTTASVVPIVLAANNNFVPYLSTMIQSIIDYADAARCYDIIVLHKDITEVNRRIITAQTETLPNCRIRFADVSRYFADIKLFVDHHLSVETYYRLVIQDLMPDYNKILYLDCDMVAEDDVAKLYDIDIGDSMIAAARDIDIAGQVKTISIVRDYITKKLGLKDPFAYFQAGVLIMNLGAFRERISVEELLKLATSDRWSCHDQDVLNMVCKGRVKYLPQEWNVVMNWQHGDECRDDYLKKAPAYIYEEYKAARNKCRIVHFAGIQKPWKDIDCDLSEHFWRHARRTPYYELMLRAAVGRETGKAGSNTVSIKRLKSNSLIAKLFPLKTRRRELIKKLAKCVGFKI